MSPNLAGRIEDIPGVAGVVVDLTDSGGGINVRLHPGADEAAVMEKVRGLLATYGAKAPDEQSLKLGRTPTPEPTTDPGVEVAVTPLEDGARVEVASTNVRSFRVVASNPSAIAQGISDAWCQVIGRVPVEIVKVSVVNDGRLEVVASDGRRETVGSGDVALGWEHALATAVGTALNASLRSDGSRLAVG